MHATLSDFDLDQREAPRPFPAPLDLARRSVRLALGHLAPPETSRAVDWARVTRELTQLHPVLHELTADEELPPKPQEDDAHDRWSGVLADIVTKLQPLSVATGRAIDLAASPEAVPAVYSDDLCSALRALMECSLAAGSGPVRVVSRIEQSAAGRQYVVTEVHNDGLDVTDTVRRKLAKAVSAHAGEMSLVSARIGSRVQIKIPVAAHPDRPVLAAA